MPKVTGEQAAELGREPDSLTPGPAPSPFERRAPAGPRRPPAPNTGHLRRPGRSPPAAPKPSNRRQELPSSGLDPHLRLPPPRSARTSDFRSASASVPGGAPEAPPPVPAGWLPASRSPPWGTAAVLTCLVAPSWPAATQRLEWSECELMCPKCKVYTGGAPGWLAGLNIRPLILAQVTMSLPMDEMELGMGLCAVIASAWDFLCLSLCPRHPLK